MAEDPLKDMRELASAAEKAKGLDRIDHLYEHECRRGTWLFVGAVGAAATIYFFDLHPGWAALAALAGGWALNEEERLATRSKIAARRAADN